jgi:hypothetical protein
MGNLFSVNQPNRNLAKIFTLGKMPSPWKNIAWSMKRLKGTRQEVTKKVFLFFNEELDCLFVLGYKNHNNLNFGPFRILISISYEYS